MITRILSWWHLQLCPTCREGLTVRLPPTLGYSGACVPVRPRAVRRMVGRV